MKQIYQKEGFTALYRGMGASLIGVSNPIVFFPVYESMKFYFKNNFEDPSADKLSSKYLIASTITGKIFANLISYPHQVIRARLQYEKIGEVLVKESMPSLIVRVVRQEGPTALYAGFSLNLIRSLPAATVYYFIYEKDNLMGTSKKYSRCWYSHYRKK